MSFDAESVKTLFLAPHNDDEVLFGTFTLLRWKPHVIVCYRSAKQATIVPTVTHEVREAETDAAMKLLGCTWHQWPTWDNWRNDGYDMRCWLQAWKHVERVFAPAVEEGGHAQHNFIGDLALDVFGRERVTHYLTYTTEGKSENGSPVPYNPEWALLKLRALACYTSQITHHELGCYPHFVRSGEEFYAVGR